MVWGEGKDMVFITLRMCLLPLPPLNLVCLGRCCGPAFLAIYGLCLGSHPALWLQLCHLYTDYDCAVFEQSLALPLFGIVMKIDHFQSCEHCWVFQIYSHYICHSLLLFFSSLWVALPAVMRFDLMWLCPSYCLIVASLLCITLSKIFWNLNHLLYSQMKAHIGYLQEKSKSISMTWKTPKETFFPTNRLLFLPPMSIYNAVCTWIATTLKSWSHLRLADKTSSLCGIFPVYSSSFL